MDDFPANSAKVRSRPEGAPPDQTIRRGEAIEQITSAEAKVRKRGIGRKFKETFVGGSARMATEYMITEVVIPAVQDTILEALQGGLERLIKGESRSRRFTNTSSYSNLGHVNYGGMNKAPVPRTISQQSRSRHDFGEIVIRSRQEAEEVIERMFDILSRYGIVSVADLYELTGIQSGHTDQKWGWTALRGAKVARLRSGDFLLDLPAPESLDGR